MKTKILFIICAVVIAVPWLFLLEILPVPYGQISTAAEVTIEGVMFAALSAAVILLRKVLKRMKGSGLTAKRVIGRILFILASVTLFIVGLILLLIAISFTL